MKTRVKWKLFRLVCFALIFSVLITFPVVSFGAPEGNGGEASEDPLFTVACFSDLHVDYGIQNNDPPIRPSTVHAAQVAQQVGGADVVLVGGDITSTNAKNKVWDETILNNAKQTVYDTLAPISKTGKVLFIAGNHEFQAGYQVKGKPDSSDYTDYMLDACGEFVAADYQTIDGRNALLGYRYCIGGMHFIGINSPYYKNSYAESWLLASQIDWLSDQMAEIGKDQTVIILCHYPADSVSTRVLGKASPDSSANNPARQKLKSVLSKYPNAIYCYGHHHSGETTYCKYKTSELVVSSSVRSMGENAVTTSAAIKMHMGSMGYYDNQFWSGGLTATDPPIVQFMMIRFYKDRMVFQMYNTGAVAYDNNAYDLASYTVYRSFDDQLSDPEPERHTPLSQFNYTLRDGKISITGYKGDAADVYVPESAFFAGNRYPVVSVGANAFSGTGVASVTLPASLESVGARAFANCSALSRVFLAGDGPAVDASAFDSSVTLYGLPGSKIESFASQNGLTFRSALDLSGAAVIFSPKIGVEYALPLQTTLICPKLYLWVRFHGKDHYLESYRLENDTARFRFELPDARYLNEPISAVVCAEIDDGDATGAEVKKSVARFAADLLAKSDLSSELRSKLTALLQYGAVAAEYTGYASAADLLVPEGDAGGDAPVLESCFSIERGKADDPVSWKGVAVKLTSSAQLMFVFSAQDVKGYTVRVSDSAKRVIAEIPAEDFVPCDAGYYACTPDIPFEQWGETLSVTVLRGVKILSSTLQYSVNSYFARTSGQAGKLGSLKNAVVRYAAFPAAEAYAAFD